MALLLPGLVGLLAAYGSPGLSDYSALNVSLSQFWDHADPRFSHISYRGWLHSEDELKRKWHQSWLGQIPWPPSVRTVAEYGIGGGLLGELLLQNHSVQKYIGIDISQRQLNQSTKRLQKCCPHKFEVLLASDGGLRDQMLAPHRIDLFVCQAVIQHFPSDEYTVHFLDVLARSRIRYLMLQTREALPTKMRKRPQNSVTFAQITDPATLFAHLPHYRVMWKSPKPEKTGYRFYWFERNSFPND